MKNLEQIIEANNFLDKYLNIKQIKEQHLDNILYKIIDKILYKYNKNFFTINGFNKNEYKNYINNLVKFSKKYILSEKILTIEIILSLHYNIMTPLTTTEKIKKEDIGSLRKLSKYISARSPEGKIQRRGFTSPKFVKKELKESLEKLNNKLNSNNKKIQFEAIIEFILFNLFITHPFDNGNDKTFSILLDVLLLKYNFFPSFIKAPRVNKKILETYAKYTPENNFEKLKKDFIENILYIYKNYQF